MAACSCVSDLVPMAAAADVAERMKDEDAVCGNVAVSVFQHSLNASDFLCEEESGHTSRIHTAGNMMKVHRDKCLGWWMINV